MPSSLRTARAGFLDSRDRYLSFVNMTNEKTQIAFYLARHFRPHGAPGEPFALLDAGTGEGTVVATFLAALRKHMPAAPLTVVGKEISADDVCILLSYLPDRFAERPGLVFHITNMTYRELQNPETVRFLHVKKPLAGDTSHDFGLRLMNMSDFVRRHWDLDFRNGRLEPRRKIVLTLFRKDRRGGPPAGLPSRFDFVIAAQPLRLSRPPGQAAASVIAPLLSMLKPGGRMTLAYSSGNDFTRPLLRALYPSARPYRNASPVRLIRAVRNLPEAAGVSARADALRYGFINMHPGRREFSLGNISSLCRAAAYAGQISEEEEISAGFGPAAERKARQIILRTKDLSMVDHVINFAKRRGKAGG